jgi:hypothetical protein
MRGQEHRAGTFVRHPRIMRTAPLLIAALLPLALHAQQGHYVRARIALNGRSLSELGGLGIAVDHGEHEPGAFTSDFARAELDLARASGFTVEELIPDVQAFYRQRAHEQGPAPRGGTAACNGPDAWPEPVHWQLGSMAGFFTLEEMEQQLDAMRAAYPQLITVKASIGSSHEGRPLWMVRLSNNADADQDRPELLYTALHHAREPVSLSQLIYFLWHLLENYGTDAEATYVLDHCELYAVPCLNPDGYVYNQTTDPGGGGMWRKNRRDNGNGTFGVDLNRNYAQGWGVDNQGSSPNSSSDVYRGPSPFSEPETQAIRAFCEAHAFRIALNYHAHGNLHIYPWGYGYGIYTPDSAQFVRNALSMTRDNRYRFGTADQTVNYVVNGGSDDWMYGEQQAKPKILSCTPECGGPADYFWPPVWRIAEIGRENLRQNLRAAELCGVFGEAADRAPAFLPLDGTHARFSIKRLGLEPGPLTVHVEPGLNVASVGAPITYADLAELEERLDSIAIEPAPGAGPGAEVRYDLVVSNGALQWRVPVAKRLGQEVLLFSDNCTSLANWDTDLWGVETSADAPSGAYLTDSPFAPYEPQFTNALTLAQPLDLTWSSAARLQFLAQWDIEGRFDGVQVLGSSDGATWMPLCGRYARPGFEDQGADLPVYDAQMPHWVEEEIDLEPYCGSLLWLRWQMRSNASRQFNGFKLDEVRVKAALGISGTPDAGHARQAWLWPNPASTAAQIVQPAAARPRKIELVDAQGRVAHQQPVPAGSMVAELSLAHLPPGLYLCRVLDGSEPTAVERLVIAR